MYLTTFIIEIVIIARSHRSVRFWVMICQHVSQSVMQVDQLNNTLLFCSNSPLISNSALVARWYFFVLFLPLWAKVIGGVLLIGSVMLFGAFLPFSATGLWWLGAFWCSSYIYSHYFTDSLARSFVLLFSFLLVLFSHLPSQELW